MDTFSCGHPRSPENMAPRRSQAPICRTCDNARHRARYHADLERKRAQARGRNLRHRRAKGVQEGHANSRKTHCPQGHAYDADNTWLAPNGARMCRACRRSHLAADHAKNRDRRLADRRRKYAEDREHRERVLAANRAWAQANPERINLISRLKKQRRRGAGTLTDADWQSVLAAYGSACLACGYDEPPTIDHVIPISRGGLNTIDNVQPLCSDCNTRKGTKTADYRPSLGDAVV